MGVNTFIQIQDLKREGVSNREIGRLLNLSEKTIRRRLKAGTASGKLGRFRHVFTSEQEAAIVEHAKKLDGRFYGLTLKSLRSLGYEYATRNRVLHRFNDTTKLAGRDWTRSFMKRNKLSLRAPRKTSIARLMGFNRQQLAVFFENLRVLMEKFKFPPQRIYNMDETGLQTVPNKLPKHIAPTGKREVAKAVAAEQGKTVSMAAAVNPVGHYVPPFFIYS